MPPTHLSPSAALLKSRSLTFREREDIALEALAALASAPALPSLRAPVQKSTTEAAG